MGTSELSPSKTSAQGLLLTRLSSPLSMSHTSCPTPGWHLIFFDHLPIQASSHDRNTSPKITNKKGKTMGFEGSSMEASFRAFPVCRSWHHGGSGSPQSLCRVPSGSGCCNVWDLSSPVRCPRPAQRIQTRQAPEAQRLRRELAQIMNSPPAPHQHEGDLRGRRRSRCPHQTGELSKQRGKADSGKPRITRNSLFFTPAPRTAGPSPAVTVFSSQLHESAAIRRVTEWVLNGSKRQSTCVRFFSLSRQFYLH